MCGLEIVCGFMAWVEAKRFRRQSTAIKATLENTTVYRLCTGQWGMQPPLLYLPRMVSMLVHVCLVLRSRLTQEASFVRCRCPTLLVALRLLCAVLRLVPMAYVDAHLSADREHVQ